ncbi:uncharacterized protein LOC106670155 [Cimex lectularius]|uniref:Uncharacterized protein n=1 Tax=Cimex lectularius TaxID=79782 RepID=A0A8I6S2L4_CIMLE|nr:uncharacterized protein LOC106670155 [Cimex lectularius]
MDLTVMCRFKASAIAFTHRDFDLAQLRLFLLLLFAVEIKPIVYEDKYEANLAQLPLDKLLHVKNSIDSDDVIKSLGDLDIESENDEKVNQEPEFLNAALPLKGDWFKTKSKKEKDNALRRDGWYEKEGKKGNIASIFQSTITILSFLAFGGYLLCMICMAIRNNQGVMVPTTAAPSANIVLTGRKRRAIDDSPVMQDIFYSLTKLAEGYAKYQEGRRK